MKEIKAQARNNALAKMFGWTPIRAGMDGDPDVLYVREFYIFTVEYKQRGKKQQENQKRREREYKKKGIAYHLIDDDGKLGQLQKTMEYHNERFNRIKRR